MDPKEYFERNIVAINRIIETIAHIQSIDKDHLDDYSSYVHLKLLENDCNRLKQYSGRNRASFSTYLRAVISKLGIDYKRKIWGRWEPSSMAVAMGKVVIEFETLITRDKHTLDHAFQILMDNYRFKELYILSDEAIDRIKQVAPKKFIDEIYPFQKEYYFLSDEFDQFMESLFDHHKFDYYINLLKDFCKTSINIKILESWYEKLPKKKKEIDFVSLDENDNKINGAFVKSNLLNPLMQMLCLDLEKWLLGYVGEMSNQDFLIISWFFVDNLPISAISKAISVKRKEIASLLFFRNKGKKEEYNSNRNVRRRIRKFSELVIKKGYELGIDREEIPKIERFYHNIIVKVLRNENCRK